MSRRVQPLKQVFFSAAVLLFLAITAVAQLPTTISISDPSGEIADLLRRGRQLELERRWSEALMHYEDAVRLHPQETSLRERFDTVRLHFDLHRRYADMSFRSSLKELSTERALNLYGQVLLKIEAHYVELPCWKALVEHGAASLAVALEEPDFIEQNVPLAKRLEIESFRDEVRRLLAARNIAGRADARAVVAEIARLAEERLDVAPTAVIMEFLCGATNALDPYSTYLTPAQLTEVYAQIEGNFVGLGVELKAQNGRLMIVRIIPGSPAAEEGVQAGEQILAVDGQSTGALSTEQAANLLQGPEGSVVRLTLAAPGRPAHEVRIRRRVVEVPSIEKADLLDPLLGVAYLRLSCFQKTTARDLDIVLWKLHHQGMKSLIIDLRGNPGGLLIAAVEAADRFISRGIIVATRGRNPQEDFTYYAHEQGKWQMPLVVLIDQNSASAAEIFAGAIRDHHRGAIVGTRSFGKGSVQGIFPLDVAEAGLRLTTARFYSPNGKPFSQVGVEPDVVVRAAAKPLNGSLPDEGADLVLETARRIAGQQAQSLQARSSF